MASADMVTVDGNEAVALVAHRTHDVIAIYPITPSSSMAELAEEWSAQGKKNLWGTIPEIMEMQSEAGAAGAVHGALQGGALTTTFTASQGLLLMIPNMYKIAGELTSFVMHVAARTVATHALSIFGDHSDVMGCRQTGFALLASGSVQEAHDLAAIAQVATLNSRIPFLHFFDGFRTSHEVNRIAVISDQQLAALMPVDAIARHRARALDPNHPFVRGTAHNPDTYFQAREACNPFYNQCAQAVEDAMVALGKLTGRQYRLFDYVGHPQAEKVVVLMGSGAETAAQTVEHLAASGQKVGAVKVRLFQPFSLKHFCSVLPPSTRAVVTLDRTKEAGAVGEPLYMAVLSALEEARSEGLVVADFHPRVLGGRYGLSSKEFTPAQVKAALDEVDAKKPINHFTVGIVDDVTHTSLRVDEDFELPMPKTVSAVFYGLGSDGTVGSNKQSIKIIGDQAKLWAQGYFVYDSKKSGAITISHLRFGPEPIAAPYLVRQAQFVACHHFGFLERRNVLEHLAPGGTFLLNTSHAADKVWDHLGRDVQQALIDKKARMFVIDADRVASEQGMRGRISAPLQTCFFALSNIMPRDEAIKHVKASIEKQFHKKGQEVIRRNLAAVDETLANLHAVTLASSATGTTVKPLTVPAEAPEFVQRVTAAILAGHGDALPVSAFPPDGTWPSGTTRWEKRAIAHEIPIWEPGLCIQCNKCAMVCPHASIRVKTYDQAAGNGAPETFRTMAHKGSPKGTQYVVQVAPDDCTGCRLCFEVCPAKDKASPRRKALNMAPVGEHQQAERAGWEHFLKLPEVDRTTVKLHDVRGPQLLQPLFEFSGACSGCGETPYIKLLTQLYGDRLVIANATGCSSIYGGNLPTTPYSVNADGRGPAWSNSLFEDNAEFGLGIRLGVEALGAQAQQLVKELAPQLGDVMVAGLLEANQESEDGIAQQRQRVAALQDKLAGAKPEPNVVRLKALADHLVRRCVWIVGGDGWAYDIGYGGLDHVLAQGRKVNILVLDTEVYSNTGGQQSKATPVGASAKFAVAGKTSVKKDLGLMAMSYGNVYVARVAFGAKDIQTVRAFQEADAYPGTSLIIAYSHCIAHGYDLSLGLNQQKLAVQAGIWPLYRFDPRRWAQGESPLKMDSDGPKGSVREYMKGEGRFQIAQKTNAQRHDEAVAMAEMDARLRHTMLTQLAAARPEGAAAPTTPAVATESAANVAKEPV